MRKVEDTNMVIVDSWWYPITVYNYADNGDLKCIGIIKIRDTMTNEEKYYIGACKGEDQRFDEDLIVKAGARFYPNTIGVC